MPLPPITITLLVQPWDTDEKVPHTFRCKPQMSAGQHFTVAQWSDQDRVRTTEIREFLNRCLMKDERDRWNDLLDGEEGLVEVEDLVVVYTDLIGRYTGSPPPSPSASGSGQADGQPTYEDAPAAMASTSAG